MKPLIPIILSTLLILSIILNIQRYQAVQQLPELERLVKENMADQRGFLHAKARTLKSDISNLIDRNHTRSLIPFREDTLGYITDYMFYQALYEGRARDSLFMLDEEMCKIVNAKVDTVHFEPITSLPREDFAAHSYLIARYDTMLRLLIKKYETDPPTYNRHYRSRPFILQGRSKPDSAIAYLFWGLPYFDYAEDNITYELNRAKISPLFPNAPDALPISHKKLTIPLDHPNEIVDFDFRLIWHKRTGGIEYFPYKLRDTKYALESQPNQN